MSRAVAERAGMLATIGSTPVVTPGKRVATVIVDSGLEYLVGTAYA